MLQEERSELRCCGLFQWQCGGVDVLEPHSGQVFGRHRQDQHFRSRRVAAVQDAARLHRAQHVLPVRGRGEQDWSLLLSPVSGMRDSARRQAHVQPDEEAHQSPDQGTYQNTNQAADQGTHQAADQGAD